MSSVTEAADPVTASIEPTGRRRPGLSSRWQHGLAVLWTVVLALIVLAPALAHGWMIGTYDLLAKSSLTSQAGVVVRGSYINTDPIVQMIPWTTLNWTQVHHAFLPLWNPYNGLGLPLAFNWQSAPFGLPSLIGYLVPVRYAYTAGVIATLVIAGTGAYVLGRLLRLGFLGAIMIAAVFELSGPMVAWLGYPQAQVMAWGGWLFAAGILVVRSSRRALAVTFFAVVTASAIYAGHPESLIVMEGAVVLFLIVLLAFRALPSRLGFQPGPVRRPAIDLAVGTVAGGALGAPLLLPALQLTVLSIRTTSAASAPPPVHDMLYLLFSSFDGVPVSGNFGFNVAFYYDETAAYVGIVAAVLALVGVVMAIRLRRPAVLAVAAIGVLMAALVYLGPLARLADRVPGIGAVNWLRALMPLSLALAVLAGVGVDGVARSPRSRTVRAGLLGGFAAAGLVLAGLWLFRRGAGLPAFGHPTAAHVRALSFVWPAAGTVVGIVGAALLWWKFRTGRWVAVALLALETAFLVAGGAVQIGSSATGYTTTPAVTALQRTVGNAVVGTGGGGAVGSCQLGVDPEVNIAFAIRELRVYDPIVPKSYFTSWQRETGTPAGSTAFDEFCPQITTVDEARRLGVGYVLEPAGQPGPPGSVLVTVLKTPVNPYPQNILTTPPGNESVYRIPGAAPVTLTAIASGGHPPSPGAAGVPVPVTNPNPSRWRMVINAGTAQVLRLHLTNVPGWHATIDGHPLVLDKFSGIMFQARIPPGRHVVELHYWPTCFTIGLAAALVAALVLASWIVLDVARRKRHDESPDRQTAVSPEA